MTQDKPVEAPITLVLFDCDGVLINSEEIAYETELAVLADAGLLYSGLEYQELFSGLAREAAQALLRSDYMKRTGQVLPDSVFEQMHHAYRAVEKDNLRPPEGLVAVLEKLRERGVPFAVATNGSFADTERKLRLTGLLDYFEGHIYSKDFVAHPKPAPDVYLHAMAQMGQSDPARCLVIEDSLTGATAGVAAGMQVVGFAYGSHRPADHAEQLRGVGVRQVALDMRQIFDIILKTL